MTPYRIQLFRNVKRKWQWRLRSRFGKVLAHSESYSSKASCRKTARFLAHNLGTTVEEGK